MSTAFNISSLFWGFVVAYFIHIVDEALLGEGFVEMVKKTFWPKYCLRYFAGFNTMMMSLFVISIILYQIFRGSIIILPLSFVFLFTTNGVWHLLATVIQKKYSPGLITSVLYWILFYFVWRDYLLTREVSATNTIIAAVIGILATVIMIGSFFILKRKYKTS